MKKLSEFASELEVDTSEPHVVENEEGADDEEFLALMIEYKQMRIDWDLEDEAQQVLKEAFKLRKEGDVSKNAKLRAAYT